MKRLSTMLLSLQLIAPAYAEQSTLTLSVPTMNCPACPITLKKALMALSGVRTVDVHYEQRQIEVIFDNDKTSVADLTRATTDAGYPSELVGERK
jgi:mercuric ion binding protein